MSEILLATKTHIPPLRSQLVNRQRLIHRLNDGLGQNNRLTLISAPAGFGKTTLINGWIRQTGIPTAWLSLDKGDNDPVRFITGLAAAIQRVAPEAGNHILAMMQVPQPPAVEAAISALINDVAFLPADLQSPNIILVLEDYHEIIAEAVHEALRLLTDHLPPPLHLVIITRIDPPLPLARFRARHEITELRSTDLRFTPEETGTFLNEIMHLNLSPEDISLLDVRTEGWIAGLQMAAVSMQGRADTAGFIRNFSGSHRFVLDFLVEEVLGCQPVKIQEFLLRTSILDRLTPSLCNAVAGVEDSQSTLAWMEQANLFLVPLDDQRQWYRYHHLFADLLRNQLKRLHPEIEPSLYSRAGKWYADRRLITPAISYALQANDFEQVEQLVMQASLTIGFYSDIKMLIEDIGALPYEIVRSHPWLSIARAWALNSAGRFDETESALREVETMLAERNKAGVKEEQWTRHVEGHLAALHSYQVFFGEGDSKQATELAQSALELLPQDDLRARAFVNGWLAGLLERAGQRESALQAIKEAVALSRMVGDLPGISYELCQLAALEFTWGKLNQALASCREAIQISEENMRQTGYTSLAAKNAYLLAGRILYERNELLAAEQSMRKGIGPNKRIAAEVEGGFTYLLLARILLARGDQAAALKEIQKAHVYSQQVSAFTKSLNKAWEALLYLQQGNLAAAIQWAQESELHFDDEVNLRTYVKHIILARVLIAQGRSEFKLKGDDRRLQEATLLLDHLLTLVESTGNLKYVIETGTLQALALNARGNFEGAVNALERALKLGEPEGFVRTFVDEGAHIARLLKEAAARGILPTYVSMLAGVLEKEKQMMAEAAQGNGNLPLPSALASQLLPEPLTERELEILPFLRSSLSLTEIADRLTISVNTARTHIKHIYDKFDVHSRSAAIDRAEKLGLL